MLTEPVAELLGTLWPATDPARVHVMGERFSALARRLTDVQHVLEEAARDLATIGDGRAAIAMSGQARRIADTDLVGVIDRLAHHATATHAYGDAVAQTQERLAVIAAIADRDLLAGQVVAAATGDTTTWSGAYDAAARVMTAAAGELDARTQKITDDLVAVDHDPDQSQSGGGAPMMAPMAGAMAAGLAGAMSPGRGDGQGAERDLADAELAMLRSRAAYLAASQPPEVAPWIRLAVGLGQAGDGRHVVVVGTSEWGGYLRPGIALEPHEIVVGDGRAPELSIMSYFADHDIESLAVCAATPTPPEVAAEIAESGARSLGMDDGGEPETTQ